MKKLLVFHPFIAPYRIDFFNDLSANFDMTLYLEAASRDNGFTDIYSICSELAFKPRRHKKSFRFSGHTFSLGIFKIIRRCKPDIVFVSEFGLTSLLTVLHRIVTRSKYKIVCLCDDSFDMVANDNDFSTIHKIMRHILPKKFDEIILVEPRIVEWYQEHFGKGIWMPIIKDDAKARKKYESLLGRSEELIKDFYLEGKTVFTFIGRFVPLKNIDRIIRAFLKSDVKNARLVLIGDGTEYEKMVKMADGHKDIIFTGRLEGDDLYPWYNIADVLILASRQEAFGAVTNEALLGGADCLVSSRCGSNCLISEGINGHLFDPDNEEYLVELINRYSESKAEKYCSLRADKMTVSYTERIDALITAINRLIS